MVKEHKLLPGDAMSYAKITACFLAMPVLVIVAFFVGWMLAAGCSRAHIFVANESRMPLSNLVVSGACKERRADALPPFAEWRTVTPYRSGGLIHLSFVLTPCLVHSYSHTEPCLNRVYTVPTPCLNRV